MAVVVPFTYMGQELSRSWGAIVAGRRASMTLVLGLLLGACGETEKSGGRASGGDAGAGGMTVAVTPRPDITGRWAMFVFEDPVGVQLGESSPGQLSGRGCAVGAPGGPGVGDSIYDFCGPVSGTVEGNHASFSFPPGNAPVTYATDVTISTDGQRMTGTFRAVAEGSGYPVSWLRVPYEQPWLAYAAPSNAVDPLEGRYELTLLSTSDGGEYLIDETYSLAYSRRTLSGALGSFWFYEMSDPAGGSPLEVGPVPATSPELATTMRIAFDAQGFTRASVTTASGHDYEFAVRRAEP